MTTHGFLGVMRVVGLLIVGILLSAGAGPLASGSQDRADDDVEWARIQGVAVGDQWTYRVTGKENGEVHNVVAAIEDKRNSYGKVHTSYRIDVEGDLTTEQRIGPRGLPIARLPSAEVAVRIEASKWVRTTDYAAVHLEGKTWIDGRLDIDVKEAYDPPLVEMVFPFTEGYKWRSIAYNNVQRSNDPSSGGSEELKLTVTVLGQEQVRVPAGTFNAWKINITGGKDPDGYKWQWYAEEVCDLVKEELYENRGEFVNRLELMSYSCSRLAKETPTYDPEWVSLLTTGGNMPPTPSGFENHPPPTVAKESPGYTLVWVLLAGAITAAVSAFELRRRVF